MSDPPRRWPDTITVLLIAVLAFAWLISNEPRIEPVILIADLLVLRTINRRRQ